jgi:hypothetical protein
VGIDVGTINLLGDISGVDGYVGSIIEAKIESLLS